MVLVRGPNDLKGLYDMMTVSRDAPSSSGCSVPIQSWMCPQAPVTDPPIAILCFPFLIPSFGIWVSEGQKERTLAVEKSAIVYHPGLESEQTAPSHTKPSCDVDAPQSIRSVIQGRDHVGEVEAHPASLTLNKDGGKVTLLWCDNGTGDWDWDNLVVQNSPRLPQQEVLSCRELGWDSSKENDNLARR
ncbi:predicted protein [Histoplasma capsulatum G186AR]|uniref:Uncharacterized protein n=1 Tax=Ajellomyces capsulatus (strain G186AR / H82 / ATCC MYA-2454 / RMSCC 2432) TaxID=447093 RepID=C0NKV2_AJECG|nr:uncharacterized protein HCBG_03782 [Histoplasma capsulatum G186AR]EEH08493.1 predicted protein [Histoplasma capsulatum G186AR]